jgi:hypothetical protein
MKNQYACALAAILLAIAFAAAIANYMYVENTAESILDSIDALPADITDASESVNRIRNEWKKRRHVLDLTLSKPALDKVSLLIDELDIAATHHADSDYKTAMARLRRAIEDIRDPERILIRNIF